MISLRAKDYHINIDYKVDYIKKKWIGIRALLFEIIHIGNNRKLTSGKQKLQRG